MQWAFWYQVSRNAYVPSISEVNASSGEPVNQIQVGYIWSTSDQLFV